MITVKIITDYFKNYVKAYKEEYSRFTSGHSTPQVNLTDVLRSGKQASDHINYRKASAANYPKLDISAYLSSGLLETILCIDGVIVMKADEHPIRQWFVHGGPAIRIDYEPSMLHQEIKDIFREQGLNFDDCGIARIVSKKRLPDNIWRGEFEGEILDQIENEELSPELVMSSYQLPINLNQALAVLTFGAFGSILDIHVKKYDLEFWTPIRFCDFGFFPADLNRTRYFKMLEVYSHIDPAAWDTRSIKMRVMNDVRRDYVIAFQNRLYPGRSVWSLGNPDGTESFYLLLNELQGKADNLSKLLVENPNGNESIFHEFLLANNILLDIYGECINKPQLKYPEGKTSPIEKSAVIPDFVIRYPDNSLRFIEIERPSKEFATEKGHPRQDFNQTNFQIMEWRSFLRNHPEEVRRLFPSFDLSKCKFTIIMSREKQSTIDNLNDYIALIKPSDVDDIWTYDDLLLRANSAISKLYGLAG